jgi:hypothetical protein
MLPGFNFMARGRFSALLEKDPKFCSLFASNAIKLDAEFVPPPVTA